MIPSNRHVLRALFGIRFTFTNRARKRSSSASRTSAGMRSTSSLSGGNAPESVSSAVSSAAIFATAGSPRARASARNDDSAESSGQLVSFFSSPDDAGAIGAKASRISSFGAGPTPAGSASASISGRSALCPSRPSSRSISPFFFRCLRSGELRPPEPRAL
jgi:hypothetical protein